VSRVRHVVLVGLMGSGKSTVGRLLAVRLGLDFVDNDLRLEARTGRVARAIEAAQGLDALHRAEAESLLAALTMRGRAVIGAAAGAVLEPDVAAALAAHDVVYLRVTPDVVAARLAQAVDHHRPTLDPAALFEARDDRYRRLATLVVDASGAPEAIVDEITQGLAR
jgi:shikimate kinase